MEEFIKLAIRYCKSDDELKAINEVAEEEAKIVLGDLNKLEVTAEPITFYSRDFATIAGFPKAMFKAGDFFADTDDVIVRYAKPEDKETHEVFPCFQIFKSKGKKSA